MDGRAAIVLPREPMAPISDETIPTEAGWGYQLKWDGVRLLALVDDGDVRLFSRKMLPKNATFPEIVRALARLKGRFLFDGEAIVFDPVKQRPDFQQVLIRERSVARVPSALSPSPPSSPSPVSSRRPVSYVLFDLLHNGDRDLKSLPYAERYARLKEVAPEKTDAVFVTDMFTDGEALWRWVEERGWEGIVSKRLSSPYREGKKHRDWLKKKTALILDVQIVGITFKEGRLSSLIMMKDGRYFGKVSLGLTGKTSLQLQDYMLATNRRHATEPASLTGIAHPSIPFSPLSEDLRGNFVVWLDIPFACTVTGLEITNAGVLRHPKLVNFTVPAWSVK